MLVYKRRQGEEIVINERLRNRVLEARNRGCQLAFDAPKTDRIRRAELPPHVEDLVQQTTASMELVG
jgi:carbon storage regulator CsrA